MIKLARLLLLASLLAVTGHGQIQVLLGSSNASAPTTVATPTTSNSGGSCTGSDGAGWTCTGTTTVTLLDSTSGATICYTNDGTTTPTATSGTCGFSPVTTYSVALSTASTTTYKVLGSKSGLTNSSVLTVVYTISGGTISLVDSKSGSSSGGGVGAVATSATMNCTGASFGGAIAWGAFNDPTTDVTISDTIGGTASGNTWTGVAPTATTSFAVLLSKFFLMTGTKHFGANQVFKATPVGASLMGISAFCFNVPTQLDNASAVNNTTGAGSSTSCVTGTATTVASPGLYIASLTDNTSGDVITAPSGFTKFEDLKAVGGNSVGGALAWLSSSTSPQSATWAYTGGSQNVCQLITAKP